MYPNYKTLEDCELIAWHRMLSDPWLSTYTMEQTKAGTWYENRRWVNPQFAFQRQIDSMTEGFKVMAETIQDALFGPMADLQEAMKNILNGITGAILGVPLNPSLTDPEGLE